MSSNTEPPLAPPGAGLPLPELLIGRFLFWLRRATASPEAVNISFESERGQIRDLVKPLDPTQRAHRVLIERVRGLEDSSRNWSVWMTLDHLRIVNEGIAQAIRTLSAGTSMPGVASTAAMKPGPDCGPESLKAFETSCNGLLEAAEGISAASNGATYAHPWFGPLDARGWHTLAAGHMRIHRAQIERIVRGLTA